MQRRKFEQQLEAAAAAASSSSASLASAVRAAAANSDSPGAFAAWEATAADAVALFAPGLSASAAADQNQAIRHIAAFLIPTAERISQLTGAISAADAQTTPETAALHLADLSALTRALSTILCTGFRLLSPFKLPAEHAGVFVDSETGLVPYRTWLRIVDRALVPCAAPLALAETRHPASSTVTGSPNPLAVAATFCIINLLMREIISPKAESEFVDECRTLEIQIIKIALESSLGNSIKVFPLVFVASHMVRIFSSQKDFAINYLSAIALLVHKLPAIALILSQDPFAAQSDPTIHTLASADSIDAWRSLLLSYPRFELIKSSSSSDFDLEINMRPSCLIRDLLFVDFIFSKGCGVYLIRQSNNHIVFRKYMPQTPDHPHKPQEHSGFLRGFASWGINADASIKPRPLELMFLCTIYQNGFFSHSLPSCCALDPIQTIIDVSRTIPASTMRVLVKAITSIEIIQAMVSKRPERIADLCRTATSLLSNSITSLSDTAALFAAFPFSTWNALRSQYISTTTSGNVSTSLLITLYNWAMRFEDETKATPNQNQGESKDSVIGHGIVSLIPSTLVDWRAYFLRACVPELFVHAYTQLYKQDTPLSRHARKNILEAVEVALGRNDVSEGDADVLNMFQMACVIMLHGKLLALSKLPETLRSDMSSNDLTLAYIDLTGLAYDTRGVLFQVNRAIRIAVLSEPEVKDAEEGEEPEIGEIQEMVPSVFENELAAVCILSADWTASLAERASPRKRLKLEGSANHAITVSASTPTPTLATPTKRAQKTESRTNVLILGEILEPPGGNMEDRKHIQTRLLDAWNALLCSLGPRHITTAIIDIFANYYPSDAKRYLEYILVEFMKQHLWVVPEIVSILPLSMHAVAPTDGSSTTSGRPLPFNRRKSPFYLMIAAVGSEEMPMYITPSKTEVSMGTCFLDHLSKRIMESAEVRQSANAQDVFGMSNHAVAFLVDCLRASPERRVSTFFQTFLTNIDGESSPVEAESETANKAVDVDRNRYCELFCALMTTWHKPDTKVTMLALQTLVFGRGGALVSEPPLQMLARLVTVPKLVFDTVCQMLAAPAPSAGDKKMQQDLIRAMLSSSLSSDITLARQQLQGVVWLINAIKKVSITTLTEMWLVPILKVTLEGSDWRAPAHRLFRYVLAPKQFRTWFKNTEVKGSGTSSSDGTGGHTISNPDTDMVVDAGAFGKSGHKSARTKVESPLTSPLGSKIDPLAEWLQVLSDAQDHPNLKTLLEIWEQIWTEAPVHDAVMLLERYSSTYTPDICNFIARQSRMLLSAKPHEVTQYLSRALTTPRSLEMIEAIRPVLCEADPNTQLCRSFYSSVETILLNIVEQRQADPHVIGKTRKQLESKIESVVTVFKKLLDMGAHRVVFACLANPAMVDMLLSQLAGATAASARNLLEFFVAVYTQAKDGMSNHDADTKDASANIQVNQDFSELLVAQETAWRVQLPMIIGRIKGRTTVPASNAILCLVSLLAANSRLTMADTLARTLSSAATRAYMMGDDRILRACLQILVSLMEKYPSKVVCESVYWLMARHLAGSGYDDHAVDASEAAAVATGPTPMNVVEDGDEAEEGAADANTLSASTSQTSRKTMQLALARALPQLYQATRTEIESVVMVSVLETLRSMSDSDGRVAILDIVEACCRYRLHRGELLCTIDTIVYALTGGSYDAYVRGVKIFKTLRAWIAGEREVSDMDIDSCSQVPSFNVSWAAKARTATLAVDRSLKIPLDRFDRVVATAIEQFASASKLLGEQAFLRVARREIAPFA